MQEKIQQLKNNLGLHARSAANFVRKASEFKSLIQVECGNKKISAKSLLGILSLNLNFADDKDHEIKVIAEGPDEKEAVDALCALIENCFVPLEKTTSIAQNSNHSDNIA